MFSKLISAALKRCIKKLPELERYRDDLEGDATLVFRDLVMQYNPELSYASYYFSRFIDGAILNHAKKNYLKHAHELSISDLEESLADERQADPFGKLIENVDLQNALLTLGDKQREAIQMYFLEDMTQEQAAKELGITQASLCKRVHRALASLKDALS